MKYARHLGIPLFVISLYFACIYWLAKWNHIPFLDLADMQAAIDAKILTSAQLEQFWHQVTVLGAMFTGFVLIWRSIVAADHLKTAEAQLHTAEESLKAARDASVKQSQEKDRQELVELGNYISMHTRPDTAGLAKPDQLFLARRLRSFSRKSATHQEDILTLLLDSDLNKRMLVSVDSLVIREACFGDIGTRPYLNLKECKQMSCEAVRAFLSHFHRQRVASNSDSERYRPLESLAALLVGEKCGIRVNLTENDCFYEMG